MKRILTIALAGSLVSGCAGRYVPLYVADVPVSSQDVPTRISATLQRLHDLAVGYDRTFQRASREADLAQVPLIGAAIAVALIAVNKPSNAADTMAKIGIGTGAYAAGRSLAAPSGGPDTFRKGVDAINCVLGEGQPFIGSGVAENVARLTTTTRNLDTTAEELADLLPMQAEPKADAKAVELARANAKLALDRAIAASSNARAQLGAYENAPVEFDRAASTIVSTLASKTAVRTVIDVSALATSWVKPSEKTPTGPATALVGPRLTYVELLNRKTESLIAQTAIVTSLAAGFQFVDRLKAVAKCPTLV